MTEDLKAALAEELRRDLWPDDHYDMFSPEMKADVDKRAAELAEKVHALLVTRGVV